MKNILIFGVGEAYTNRKYFFEDNADVSICGFIDNNDDIHGIVIDGAKVYAPNEIQNLRYDAVVLLSNQYYQEQKQQLIDLEVPNHKIWDYYRLKRELASSEDINYEIEISKEDLLIITFQFGIGGGSLAALYLAEALKHEWENIYIATDNITDEAKKLVEKYEFKLLIYKLLPYMSDRFAQSISRCGLVIVNTLQMLPSALGLHRKGVPVYVWLHEGEEIWYEMIGRVINKNDIPKKLPILFVSDVSKSLFEKYFAPGNGKVVPIALPDRMKDNSHNLQNQFRVAVIGLDTPNKNQTLIIKAVKMLPDSCRRIVMIDFYGVGRKGGKRIEDAACGCVKIKVHGVISPEELHRNLDDTDCVVCTSLMECLPTAAIEGFMHKCIVVVPDTAGISTYISDRENGFIYRVNDEKSLAETIKEILDNRTDYCLLKENARKTYEKYFTYASLREAFMNLVLEK